MVKVYRACWQYLDTKEIKRGRWVTDKTDVSAAVQVGNEKYKNKIFFWLEEREKPNEYNQTGTRRNASAKF